MIHINPFDPMTLLLIALLNPATIAIAWIMGRGADQWQNPARAAAKAGFLLYYAAAFVDVFKVHAVGGEAGLVALQVVFGFVWASAAYITTPRKV